MTVAGTQSQPRSAVSEFLPRLGQPLLIESALMRAPSLPCPSCALCGGVVARPLASPCWGAGLVPWRGHLGAGETEVHPEQPAILLRCSGTQHRGRARGETPPVPWPFLLADKTQRHYESCSLGWGSVGTSRPQELCSLRSRFRVCDSDFQWVLISRPWMLLR